MAWWVKDLVSSLLWLGSIPGLELLYALDVAKKEAGGWDSDSLKEWLSLTLEVFVLFFSLHWLFLSMGIVLQLIFFTFYHPAINSANLSRSTYVVPA